MKMKACIAIFNLLEGLKKKCQQRRGLDILRQQNSNSRQQDVRAYDF